MLYPDRRSEDKMLKGDEYISGKLRVFSYQTVQTLPAAIAAAPSKNLLRYPRFGPSCKLYLAILTRRTCRSHVRRSSNHSNLPSNDFACDHTVKSQLLGRKGQSRCSSQPFPGKVTTWGPQITKKTTAFGWWERRLCLD